MDEAWEEKQKFSLPGLSSNLGHNASYFSLLRGCNGSGSKATKSDVFNFLMLGTYLSSKDPLKFLNNIYRYDP